MYYHVCVGIAIGIVYGTAVTVAFTRRYYRNRRIHHLLAGGKSDGAVADYILRHNRINVRDEN